MKKILNHTEIIFKYVTIHQCFLSLDLIREITQKNVGAIGLSACSQHLLDLSLLWISCFNLIFASLWRHGWQAGHGSCGCYLDASRIFRFFGSRKSKEMWAFFGAFLGFLPFFDALTLSHLGHVLILQENSYGGLEISLLSMSQQGSCSQTRTPFRRNELRKLLVGDSG